MRTFVVVHNFQEHHDSPNTVGFGYVREKRLHQIVNLLDDCVIDLLNVRDCSGQLYFLEVDRQLSHFLIYLGHIMNLKLLLSVGIFILFDELLEGSFQIKGKAVVSNVVGGL